MKIGKFKDLYYAEKIFLKNCLFENCSILDIGCAQGGLTQLLKNLLISLAILV